jgi:hypothetical protein
MIGPGPPTVQLQFDALSMNAACRGASNQTENETVFHSIKQYAFMQISIATSVDEVCCSLNYKTCTRPVQKGAATLSLKGGKMRGNSPTLHNKKFVNLHCTQKNLLPESLKGTEQDRVTRFSNPR